MIKQRRADMKDYARTFYSSKAWKNCRNEYRKSVGGLCERCLAKGLIVPGEIVHHKIHLTPENINNPAVALSWDNLELVCRECHEAIHSARQRRYKVDAFGRVSV